MFVPKHVLNPILAGYGPLDQGAFNQFYEALVKGHPIPPVSALHAAVIFVGYNQRARPHLHAVVFPVAGLQFSAQPAVKGRRTHCALAGVSCS